MYYVSYACPKRNPRDGMKRKGGRGSYSLQPAGEDPLRRVLDVTAVALQVPQQATAVGLGEHLLYALDGSLAGAQDGLGRAVALRRRGARRASGAGEEEVTQHKARHQQDGRQVRQRDLLVGHGLGLVSVCYCFFLVWELGQGGGRDGGRSWLMAAKGRFAAVRRLAG